MDVAMSEAGGPDRAGAARRNDPSNDPSATNAFASTLAAMLTPTTPQARPKVPTDGHESELSGTAGVTGGERSARGTTETRDAHAAAADVRAAASSAGIDEVNSDPDALNPDFRARLGRVITRMRDEFGHDVEMVEGFRPQDRQNFLYEQGRTRPGQVVTWTRSSKHTLGLAADLKIDGSYDNTAAYQQLARVAAQEGLHTLGARDPGHVELRGRADASAWGDTTLGTTRLDHVVSRAMELALGQDDTPEPQSGPDLNGLLSRATRGTPSVTGNVSATGSGSTGGFGGFMQQQGTGRESHDGAGRDARPGEVSRVAGVAQVASIAQVAHVAEVAHAATPAGVTTPGAGAQATPGLGGAERVGHILDVREASSAQPLSRMTLALDDASGGTDRITVNLRGGAVDASIATGDSARADRLSLRTAELQRALEHHGLDAGSIRVGATTQDSGAGWTPRNGNDAPSREGQRSPDSRDARRQDAGDARQRSRREQSGGK